MVGSQFGGGGGSVVPPSGGLHVAGDPFVTGVWQAPKPVHWLSPQHCGSVVHVPGSAHVTPVEVAVVQHTPPAAHVRPLQ